MGSSAEVPLLAMLFAALVQNAAMQLPLEYIGGIEATVGTPFFIGDGT